MDAMGIPGDEYERLIFFETTREKAAAEYSRSPDDADNLIRWGGSLLELAQFRQGQESIDMVVDAASKFEEALKLTPKKAETLWCLGNAYTSHGFLLTDTEMAKECFKKSASCFQQALEEDPTNELYRKASEMSEKAPALHLELQKQLSAQQAMMGSSSGLSGGHGNTSKGSKEKKSSDLKYDVLGWIVLGFGFLFWASMAKSAIQAPPP